MTQLMIYFFKCETKDKYSSYNNHMVNWWKVDKKGLCLYMSNKWVVIYFSIRVYKLFLMWGQSRSAWFKVVLVTLGTMHDSVLMWNRYFPLTRYKSRCGQRTCFHPLKTMPSMDHLQMRSFFFCGHFLLTNLFCSLFLNPLFSKTPSDIKIGLIIPR